MKLRHIRRTIALLLISAMILTILTGCKATGGDTPEEITTRFIAAMVDTDIDAFMDCMLPSLSIAYQGAMALTTALVGYNAEAEMMEEMQNYLPGLYGYSTEELTKLDCEVVFLDQQAEADTTVLHALLILKVNDKFDYSFGYITTSRLGDKWYINNVQESEPYSYEPTSVTLDTNSAFFKKLIDYLDAHRTYIGDVPLTDRVVTGADVGYPSNSSFAATAVQLPVQVDSEWDTLSLSERRLWFDLYVRHDERC